MDFFSDGAVNGGYIASRSEICSRINELYEKIDEENEKKEELLFELTRIERAIERFRDLLCDMEALLK